MKRKVLKYQEIIEEIQKEITQSKLNSQIQILNEVAISLEKEPNANTLIALN
jgi:dihydroneopterin aldolase